MLRTLVLAISLACVTTGSVVAQGPMMHSSSVWAASVFTTPTAALTVRMASGSESYWLTGLAIGGAAGGIAGGFIGNGLCNESDAADAGGCTGSTILGAVVGAAIGMVPGALIGGRFKKKPKPASAE